ncbi:S26 family signal peptidase [Idiomarina sp. OXR-189]
MGDHRDNSPDSRYIGFIPRDQIKGRVFRGMRALDSF